MKSLWQSRHLSLAATALVLAALFTAASLSYTGFFSGRVMANLFADNAFLGIAAVGMTLVILSGGIDLSVGALLAFTTVFVARLIEYHGVPPGLAIAYALLLGSGMGAAMGCLIARYELPPFLVTLGGMFFARGMAFVVSRESIGLTHPVYVRLQEFNVPLGGRASLSSGALALGVIFIAGVLATHHTRFGRNVFAIGGSETSARLMGLPVAATKVAVYTISGFCSALGGVVATWYMGSGNPALGSGFELDVIACVVMGGTLLTGGVGSQIGTLIGVLIFGTIQTALVFDGRLNSWWLRIAMGLLLLVFILLQRFLSRATPPGGLR